MSQPMRDQVPYDVVNDIFGRLPVKSLTRFRSVSKSCNSIISDPTFISTLFSLNLTKSLISTNTHSGYLLYTPTVAADHSSYTSKQLCTVVCNNDRTLTQVSKVEIPSFLDKYSIVGFCNSVFCLASYDQDFYHIIYLWNPSIRKFKKLLSTRFLYSDVRVVFGFAFDSKKNNDFKVLRLVTFREKKPPAEAEIYTLSTDSWRKVIITMESLRGYEPNFGPIVSVLPPSVFCNGALHFIAYTCRHHFILSFDVHDETFHEIMMPLPQNYSLSFQLAVFKGLLAVIINFSGFLGHFWVMEEYGVVGSWTRKFFIPKDSPHDFYGCTDNGELLFKSANGLVSVNPPESLDWSILAIEDANWVGFSANSMESLVLHD